jgi:hypothetical protein
LQERGWKREQGLSLHCWVWPGSSDGDGAQGSDEVAVVVLERALRFFLRRVHLVPLHRTHHGVSALDDAAGAVGSRN